MKKTNKSKKYNDSQRNLILNPRKMSNHKLKKRHLNSNTSKNMQASKDQELLEYVKRYKYQSTSS